MDRSALKRVWALDVWHLRNRLLRAILMHTLCLWLNQQEQAPFCSLIGLSGKTTCTSR